MAKHDFDLFVIGGGSGGVRAARIAGGHGARVAVAEEYRYGGTCVIRGCIPKKLFTYAAHYAEDFEDARAYGWDVEARGFDWPTLVANKDKEIDRLEGVYERLLAGAGVEVLKGRAVLEDAHTVRMGERRFTADVILVATGGAPTKPEIPGAELAITSNEAFHLERLPEHVTIVGGGYIAVEFAGIFSGLACGVTELHRGELILRGFDADLRVHLATEMKKKGVDLRLSCDPTRIEKRGEGYAVTLRDGSCLETGLVMFATGRRPNTEGLGLEKAGVALRDDGAVAVDEWSRTNVENVYAVGDVTDRLQLTPVALMEGHCFADSVFGGKPRRPDHENVASAVFSNPPLATVGLSEEAARLRFGALRLFKSSFRTLKHTLTPRDEKSFMKLVVDAATDRVVGAHMIGPDAAEIMQGVAIAVKLGATKAQFDETVGIHPSAAEEFVTMRTAWSPAAPEAKAAE
jgi:glutathione reductase (NADPH)